MSRDYKRLRGRRCARCRMLLRLCMCSTIERLDSRTRVVVVAHVKEWCKPTCTSRPAVLALRRAELALSGANDPRLDASLLLREGQRHVVLYASPDAPVLEPRDARPVTLLVPDGTWGQAARIASTLSALPGVEVARLELELPERSLRRAPGPGRAPTGVAIAQALLLLGDEAAAVGLASLVDRLVDRGLSARGVRE